MADAPISSLTSYTTPLDADVMPIVDTANATTKKVTWENIKVVLKAYFDSIYVTIGGALGTPSSGTLTNCTGLLIAGLVSSTSTALGVGSIELGNASDTTLSRSSGGVLAVEGVVIPSISSTNTLTNKFITPQLQSVADAGGTFTPISITNDMGIATALSQATTIAAPSGSPVQGESLIIRLKDNGSARALTWNAIYRAGTTVTLPTTTTLSKTLYCGFKYNSTDTKWDLLAYADGF